MVVRDGKVLGAGVFVIKDRSVLLCERSDGQGWCIPGGKVDEGETFEVAAKRELFEEAGIQANTLVDIGEIFSNAHVHGEDRDVHSRIYVCDSYEESADSLKTNFEISKFVFIPFIGLDFFEVSMYMFKPTIKGLELLRKHYGMKKAY